MFSAGIVCGEKAICEPFCPSFDGPVAPAKGYWVKQVVCRMGAVSCDILSSGEAAG